MVNKIILVTSHCINIMNLVMQLGNQDILYLSNYAPPYHTNLHLVLAIMYIKNRYKHITQMECKTHDEPKTNDCNLWNIFLIWPKYNNRWQPKYNQNITIVHATISHFWLILKVYVLIWFKFKLLVILATLMWLLWLFMPSSYELDDFYVYIHAWITYMSP